MHSGSTTIWEKIGTVSNTSQVLSLTIPTGANSYALIYAICSLNTTFSPGYDATRTAVIFGSNGGAIHTFVEYTWSQNAFMPFQYISPIVYRASSSSGVKFTSYGGEWIAGVTGFFGIKELINAWTVCTGSVGQISATFYGIKASP